MGLVVERYDAPRQTDFDRFHDGDEGCRWCRCVAWWVPTWDGWGERTEEANRALRASLAAGGEHDGYLAYADGEPVGWCQAGPRDRLAKLCSSFELAPAPSTWAVTCFAVAPAARRSGVARALLAHVIADAPERGATRLEAFPRRGASTDPGELWNGPEALFRASGFEVVREVPPRVIVARDLPVWDNRA